MILEAEFDRVFIFYFKLFFIKTIKIQEKEEMLKNFKKKEKELKDLIQTVKDEDKKKENDLITEH